MPSDGINKKLSVIVNKLMQNRPLPERTEWSDYTICGDDRKRIDEWLAVQYKDEIERKRAWYESNNTAPNAFEVECWESGYPYHGAIGGGLTYQFTPTSIGTVFKVIYSAFDGEISLDLTDYDFW